MAEISKGNLENSSGVPVLSGSLKCPNCTAAAVRWNLPTICRLEVPGLDQCTVSNGFYEESFPDA